MESTIRVQIPEEAAGVHTLCWYPWERGMNLSLPIPAMGK